MSEYKKKMSFQLVLKLHLGFFFSYTDQTHAEVMSTVHQRCSHFQLLYELYGKPTSPPKNLQSAPKICKIPPHKQVQQLKGPPSQKRQRFFFLTWSWTLWYKFYPLSTKQFKRTTMFKLKQLFPVWPNGAYSKPNNWLKWSL